MKQFSGGGDERVVVVVFVASEEPPLVERQFAVWTIVVKRQMTAL